MFIDEYDYFTINCQKRNMMMCFPTQNRKQCKSVNHFESYITCSIFVHLYFWNLAFSCKSAECNTAERACPAVTTALRWKRSHLCHKVCGCIAQCLQHGCGFRVEQRHPVGHLVVDFILNVQLKGAETNNTDKQEVSKQHFPHIYCTEEASSRKTV